MALFTLSAAAKASEQVARIKLGVGNYGTPTRQNRSHQETIQREYEALMGFQTS